MACAKTRDSMQKGSDAVLAFEEAHELNVALQRHMLVRHPGFTVVPACPVCHEEMEVSRRLPG